MANTAGPRRTWPNMPLSHFESAFLRVKEIHEPVMCYSGDLMGKWFVSIAVHSGGDKGLCTRPLSGTVRVSRSRGMASSALVSLL